MIDKNKPYGGSYRGYDFYIRPGYAGNPCGYVRVDDCHKLKPFIVPGDYASVDKYIDMHEGCTYVDHLPGQEGLWIGFDTSHLFDDEWTQNTTFVELECEHIINQLIAWEDRLTLKEGEKQC